MLITPHVLTGAAIATLIPIPYISIPLALGSHFLLDNIIHWQETRYPYIPTMATWIRIPIDLILSIAMIWFITKRHPNNSLNIWLTAFAAAAPDLNSIAVFLPQLRSSQLFLNYCTFHEKLQRETASWWGIVPQAVLTIISIIISLY